MSNTAVDSQTVDFICAKTFAKLKRQIKFIFGIDKNYNRTASVFDDNVFHIFYDSDTKRYYYVIIAETKQIVILNHAVAEFKLYLKENNIAVTCDIDINDIYDIESLTSADTLPELYKRLIFVQRYFNNF